MILWHKEISNFRPNITNKPLNSCAEGIINEETIATATVDYETKKIVYWIY